jgi:acyl carrier protein
VAFTYERLYPLFQEARLNQDVVANRIRQFLVAQFPGTKNVNDDAPLLKNGLIDSLGILEVVSFVESEFSILVFDDDLMPENFGSVRSIAEFVQSKTDGAGG